MVLGFTCVVAVDGQRRTGVLEQGSCGGSRGTWGNTSPLPWGLGGGGRHWQKPVFNSWFWNSQQIPYRSSKLELYLQDLRPVLKASKTIPHLQTEGWLCCALGKPVPRRVLFTTSALLSNLSPDTIPSPAQMTMASLFLEQKELTFFSSTEVNLLQNTNWGGGGGGGFKKKKVWASV